VNSIFNLTIKYIRGKLLKKAFSFFPSFFIIHLLNFNAYENVRILRNGMLLGYTGHSTKLANYQPP